MVLGHSRNLKHQIYEFIVGFIETEGRPPTIREIGRVLGITSTSHITHYLRMLEKEGSIRREQKKSRGIKLTSQSEGIPVIGAIAAGSPLDIFPRPARLFAVDHILGDKNAFALVVRGNSMIRDYICDGDYILITPEPNYYEGDIVVAVHLLGGVHGSATLKRLLHEKERRRVCLQPSNPEVEPLFVSEEDWDREWQVQGKVIAILRHYQAAYL